MLTAARPNRLRRAFDLIAAGVGLVLLSPLLGVIALAIKIDDGGKVFYAQPRVGKEFRIFKVLKFRSMLAGADGSGLLTAPKDARVTRVGRFLRRHKLDELPQLMNVLRGEMQLVGSRPEVERYVHLFRAQYAALLQDPPGLTDPASLAYRHEDTLLHREGMEEQYISQILPAKLKLSLDYAQRRHFLSDLAILFRTISPFEIGSPSAGGAPSHDSSQDKATN